MRRNSIWLGAVIAAFLGVASMPATAAPAGTPAIAKVGEFNGQVEKVHYRYWRHHHRRHWNRGLGYRNYGYRSYGWYQPNYGYYRRPGLSFYYGGGHRNRGWY